MDKQECLYHIKVLYEEIFDSDQVLQILNNEQKQMKGYKKWKSQCLRNINMMLDIFKDKYS